MVPSVMHLLHSHRKNFESHNLIASSLSEMSLKTKLRWVGGLYIYRFRRAATASAVPADSPVPTAAPDDER